MAHAADQVQATEVLPAAPCSLVELLKSAIDRYQNRVAFIEGETQITYREIDRRSTDLADLLQTELGIEMGDRVAIMLPNCIPFPISAIAILRCGGVIVNVNPFYTEREFTHQMRDAGVEALIVDADSLNCVANAVPDTLIKSVIVLGNACESAKLLPKYVKVMAWSDIQSAAELANLIPSDIDLESIALLQYTGGTTGRSKGAILRHRNINANAAQIRAALRLNDGNECHCVLTALPLYHIFAFTVNFITLFSIGACNILIRKPSELDTVVRALMSHQVTFMTGVNTLYANIVRHRWADKVDWSRLGFAIGGGSAILPTTSESWRTLTGRHILEGLGMTETSPVLTVNPPDRDGFSNTVGLALPGTDIAIIDEQGMRCQPGEAGEICVKGPQVMSGYWGVDSEDDDVFTVDGYFKSGDVGVMDEDGYLKVVDRKKDMILVSGFNVYPNEVEAVATEYPAVLECACVGIPDAKTGEAVKIFIKVDNQMNFDADEFLGHCRIRLAGYKVPRHVEVLDELPKSTVGKILRRHLR